MTACRALAQIRPAARPPDWRSPELARAAGPAREHWRPLMSARARILGSSVLLLALALAASVGVTHLLLVRQVNGQAIAELRHEIAEFRRLAARREPQAGMPGTVTALLRARTSQAILENDVALLGMVNGRVVATSANSAAAAFGASPALLARWAVVDGSAAGTGRLGGRQARYAAVSVRIPGDPARGVFIAAVLTGRDLATVARTTRLQIEAEAVALLAGCLIAWLAAGRVLRPVRQTTELARRITDTDLSGRIPVRGHSEVSELAATFNGMLDRLAAALTAQRRFLADAGHELRTPITIIQGNLDILTVSDAEDAATLAIAADELARMTMLVDELLLLAGSERPDFLHPAPADLAALTAALAAKARALGRRPWLLAGSAQGRVMLDEQRITQAVMQLAANAAAHTPAGLPVELSSAIVAGRVVFTVADRGPGIPPGQRQRIFDRFARLDQRRTEGGGLGLSIVAAIAVAHQGRVEVTDRTGGGAVFRLSVPCVFVPQEREDSSP
ncbi:MAG: ATP-binding protein [Streptosporangiaceae bacterium]